MDVFCILALAAVATCAYIAGFMRSNARIPMLAIALGLIVVIACSRLRRECDLVLVPVAALCLGSGYFDRRRGEL